MNKQTDSKAFSNLLKKAKLRLLQMHFESNVGHIGGNLSCLDFMLWLQHFIMCDDDKFVLAKGHAAGALYITLWTMGLLSEEDLYSFHKDGTKVAGHPMPGWHSAIPVATGSLGHGLPVSTGLALSKKLCNKPGQVYCLCSDGEMQEGSNWESLIFARHHKLDNLTIIIDENRLQGFGVPKEITSLESMHDVFVSLGLHPVKVDGHNPHDFESAFKKMPGSPGIIILKTIKGHGVSFMENKMEWHYLTMNESQYFKAKEEIEANEKRTL